jgi:hypothetical protein
MAPASVLILLTLYKQFKQPRPELYSLSELPQGEHLYSYPDQKVTYYLHKLKVLFELRFFQ